MLKIKIGDIIGCWRCCSFSHKNVHLYWVFACTNCGIERIKQTSDQKLSAKCQNCYGLSAGQSGFNVLLANYKRRCRPAGRHLERKQFLLTNDQFMALTKGKCFYCGTPPLSLIEPNRSRKTRQQTPRWGQYIYNGIDRVDNNLGYTIDNCVSCCEICNRAKKAMLQGKFVEYIRRIAKHAIVNDIPCLGLA